MSKHKIYKEVEQKKMQVLVPIAGFSPFFPEEDFFFPKPLIEVVGKPMIERVVCALRESISNPTFVFTVLQEQARRFSLDGTLQILGGKDCKVIEKINETKGALCSCLLAIDEINHDEELIVCNSDQIIDADLQRIIEKFREKEADAGVIAFRSLHPRWSYVLPEDDLYVAQTFEKRVVSDIAIAGFYYFRTAQSFFDAAQKAILNGDDVGGDFFISAAINQIILNNGKVVYEKIKSSSYHSFYSPEKIKEFCKTTYAKKLRHEDEMSTTVNVIIPAAGAGSRFAKLGWRKPKPFIDVNGRSMIEHVIENVTPVGYIPTILLQKEHINKYPEEVRKLKYMGCNIREVDGLTEGTACTVLLARDIYDNDSPMLVANADQLVDFDCKDFVADCLKRNLDGSILVFRDKLMDPKWSFVKLDEKGLVTEVAEKKAISDLATVGIYLFRRGSDFVRAAVDMIAHNDRVNNEFYTCPVYNYMIRNGLKIGVYEVPAQAMKGLGTPEDLNHYLKEIGAPKSVDAPD